MLKLLFVKVHLQKLKLKCWFDVVSNKEAAKWADVVIVFTPDEFQAQI